MYKDNEQEQVTKTLAGEKAKLSQMTTSQKFEYIFEYYKLHMLVVLLIICFIGWFVHHRMTYVDYKLYGVVINSDQVNESLEQTVPSIIGMGKHEGVSLVSGLSAQGDAVAGNYYNQIDLDIVSSQMDFAFTDEEGVQYLCDLCAPQDVKAQLPENLMSLWSGRETSFSQRNQNDDTYFDNYAAIDISGTKVHDYFGLDDSIKYLVITDLSGNQEYMDNFYQLLYQIETGKVKGE